MSFRRHYGCLCRHEAFIYLSDSLFLFLAVSAYVFVWPTRFNGDRKAVENEGFALVKGTPQESAWAYRPGNTRSGLAAMMNKALASDGGDRTARREER